MNAHKEVTSKASQLLVKVVSLNHTFLEDEIYKGKDLIGMVFEIDLVFKIRDNWLRIKSDDPKINYRLLNEHDVQILEGSL